MGPTDPVEPEVYTREAISKDIQLNNMKNFILVLSILFFSGCGTVLTNEQIILETEKCAKAGLESMFLYVGNKVSSVQCVTKEELKNWRDSP